MNARLLLAGVLGALAMFTWSFVAHMLLPLGDAGISEMPNEKAIMAALKENLGEKRGFYIFPGSGLEANATGAERRAAMEEIAKVYETRPTGVLIYRPPGRPFAFGKWLGYEFLLELVEALLAVALLSQTRLSSYAGRVLFITVVGFIAAITTNGSYLNWYGFPKTYTFAYMTTQTIGFFCLGLVAALLLKKRATA